MAVRTPYRIGEELFLDRVTPETEVPIAVVTRTKQGLIRTTGVDSKVKKGSKNLVTSGAIYEIIKGVLDPDNNIVGAAGADTEIQYNAAGVFGASPQFTFAYTTNILKVGTATLGQIGLGATAPVYDLDIQKTHAIQVSARVLNQGTGHAGLYLQRTGGIANKWFIAAWNGTTELRFHNDNVNADNIIFHENGNQTIRGLVGTGTRSVVVTAAGLLTAGAASTGGAAGSDRQVQWNNAGAFGADAGLVYTAAGNLGIGASPASDETLLLYRNDATTMKLEMRQQGDGAMLHRLHRLGVAPVNWTMYVAGGSTPYRMQADGTDRFFFTTSGNLTVTGLAGTGQRVVTVDATGLLTIGAAGNGGPAGANRQVQWNNNGVFGADAGFTYTGPTSATATLTSTNVGAAFRTVSTQGDWITGQDNGGSGAANQFYIYDGAAGRYLLTIQKGSTYVGIGPNMVTPETMVHVKGTYAALTLESTGNDVNYIIKTAASFWAIGTNNGGNGTSGNQYYVYNNLDGGAGGYYLSIQRGSGNVGIGTAAPTRKFTVNGDAQIGLGTNTQQDILYYTTTSRWQVGANNSGDSNGGVVGGPVTNKGMYYIYDVELGNYAFTIQKLTGYIGIGTNLPTEKLQLMGGHIYVKNTAMLSAFVVVESMYGSFTMGTNSVGNGTNGSQWCVYEAATDKYRLTVQRGTGNVGIGTTAPTTILHIKGATVQVDNALGSGAETKYLIAAGSWQTGTNNGGNNAGAGNGQYYIVSTTDGAYYLTVQRGGNVGIGTAAPTVPLQVTDKFFFHSDGRLGVGAASPSSSIYLDVTATNAGLAAFRLRNLGAGRVTITLVREDGSATAGSWTMEMPVGSTRMDFFGPASGTLNFQNKILTTNTYGRSSHHIGHLEGGYNNIGSSASYSNPIYTIGSAYNPNETTLGTMYGIGYSHAASTSFLSHFGGGWGLYVAENAVARIFLDAQNGTIRATDKIAVGTGTPVFTIDAMKTTGNTQIAARNSGAGEVGFYLDRTGTTPSNWYAYIAAGSTHYRLNNGVDRYVFDTAGTASGTYWNSTSDITVKTNIVPFTNGIAKVLAIAALVKTYDRIDNGIIGETGFIAQQLQAVAPEYVKPSGIGLKLGVTYGNMVGPLYKAFAEMKDLIDDLKVDGTFTPTLFNTTNVAASTAFEWQYRKIGRLVILTGRVDVDPTAAGTTVLGISIPIPSNFANARRAGGSGVVPALSGQGGGAITADNVNGRLLLTFTPVAPNTNRSFFVQATYWIDP